MGTHDIDSALHAVIWVIKSHRAHHPDPRVRRNVSFKLPRPSGGYFSPTQISQFENWNQHRQLTPSIMRAYEATLGLEPDALTDLYFYIARNRGQQSSPRANMNESQVDIVLETMHGERRAGSDWILTAHALTTGQVPSGPRSRASIASHLIDTLKEFTGPQYRVVREAAVILGPMFSHEYAVAVDENPAQSLHLLEPLGFMDAAIARPTLAAVTRTDGWYVASALESLGRLLEQADRIEDPHTHHALIEDVRRLLENPDPSVQHQAGYVASRGLADDPGIRQVLGQHENSDVARFIRRLEQNERRLAMDITEEVEDQVAIKSGLEALFQRLVTRALFGQTRIARSEAAWTLAISAYGPATSDAVWGRVLANRRPFDEAVERNLVRLGGRLGGPLTADRLKSVIEDESRADSVRLAALWDLPGAIDRNNPPEWLGQIFDTTLSRHVRRACVTAAGAIGDQKVLARARTDPDAEIRSESRRWS